MLHSVSDAYNQGCCRPNFQVDAIVCQHALRDDASDAAQRPQGHVLVYTNHDLGRAHYQEACTCSLKHMIP